LSTKLSSNGCQNIITPFKNKGLGFNATIVTVILATVKYRNIKHMVVVFEYMQSSYIIICHDKKKNCTIKVLITFFFEEKSSNNLTPQKG
jgi:hypothetical protein